MNAFQRTARRIAKGLFGVSFGTPGRESWNDAQDWIRGLFENRAGKLTKPYVEHATFSRCIEVIARDAAAVEWEMYPRDLTDPSDEDPIEDSPVLDLWRNPNQYMLGNQLWIGSYLSKLIWGEWIWYYPDMVAMRPGAPVSAQRAAMTGGGDRIALLCPANVEVKQRSNGSLRWVLMRDGAEEELDERRLTISRRWNPYNPLRGLPLAASIAIELQSDHDAAGWNARFFGEQNGIPSGLLIPGQGTSLDRDQRKEIQRTWNQRHAGTKRSIAILPGGWTFTDLGVTQKDMSFLELRGMARDTILARTGVPPLIAGFLDTTIRYNAREQKDIYWNSTIYNFLIEEQSVINEDFLVKLNVSERAWPKWESVRAMLDDMETKSNIARTFFEMGVPFREINERLELGFDPDKHPSPDVGFLSAGLVTAESVENPIAPVAPPMPPAGVNDTASRLMLAMGDEETRRAMVWRAVIGRARDLEVRFERMVRKHFHDIAKEALAVFDRAREQSVTRDGRFFVFDLDEAKRKLRRLAEPIYRAIAERGGESVMAELGVGISFNVDDPIMRAKLAILTGQIVKVDETVERHLRASILEGIDSGETVEELRDRIANTLQISLGRARTIARTETGKAFNVSRNEGMKQAGIKRQEWVSSRDPDVRDSHIKPASEGGVDGQTVFIGEPFSNGLLFPQDPAGPAEEVINCRCVAVPVPGNA
jgi:phage portal protein BeeE